MLTRNILQHGSGEILIEATTYKFTVRNSKSKTDTNNDQETLAYPYGSNVGDTPHSNEHGIGIEIVHRICEANDWVYTVSNSGAEYVVDVELS